MRKNNEEGFVTKYAAIVISLLPICVLLFLYKFFWGTGFRFLTSFLAIIFETIFFIAAISGGFKAYKMGYKTQAYISFVIDAISWYLLFNFLNHF